MSDYTLRRILALAALAVMLGVVGAVISPAIAGAHTPSASATCDELTVTLEWYPADTTVTVTIDGTEVASETFEGNYAETFPFPDRTVASSWLIDVFSPDDPQGEHGWTVTLDGTTDPCLPVTTTTVPETTTTTEAPTTTTVRTYECDGTGDGIAEHDYNDPADGVCAPERPADPPPAPPVEETTVVTLPVTGPSEERERRAWALVDVAGVILFVGGSLVGLSRLARTEVES